MKTTEIAEKLKGKKKLIFTHGNSDMDAIGSAYGLKCAFEPADICAPAGVDRVAKMVAETLDIPILETADMSQYDLVVVVDTSSPELLQTPDLVIPKGSLIIDHHAPTGKWEDMDFNCDETRTSCCEIVKEIIESAGIEIQRHYALALLGGMLTDSGHFQFADHRMLRAFADLLERCNIGMDEAMTLTRAPMSMSERIAAMKAIGRSKFQNVADMVVASSFGSSFEAASCRALLASGADVVFVGSQRDDQFRVSARATQEMVRRGIKLDAIMAKLSKETFTDGGGHGGAAGMTGTGDAEFMVNSCVELTMEEFRKIKAVMEAQRASQDH